MPEGMAGKNFVRRVYQPVEDVFLGSSIIYGGFSEKEKTNLYSDDFAEQQSVFNSHNIVRQTLERMSQASTLHKMIYVDTRHWLADSHLIMMDKMSMANSIELRAPMLDHRLVELAAAMPEKFKVNLFNSKIVLRNAFKPEIPESILTRAKRGFSTPINLWLKRSESEMSEILMNQRGLAKDLFKKNEIEKLLDKHKQGRADFSAHIFTLLVLSLWSATFLENH